MAVNLADPLLFTRQPTATPKIQLCNIKSLVGAGSTLNVNQNINKTL